MATERTTIPHAQTAVARLKPFIMTKLSRTRSSLDETPLSSTVYRRNSVLFADKESNEKYDIGTDREALSPGGADCSGEYLDMSTTILDTLYSHDIPAYGFSCRKTTCSRIGHCLGFCSPVLFNPKWKVKETAVLLEIAAWAALRMPKLRSMTGWTGGYQRACAFTYRLDGVVPTITWRGTTYVRPGMVLESHTIRAWGLVSCQQAGLTRLLFRQSLDHWKIFSHGDAIACLGLPRGVIDSVSPRQIRAENKPVEKVLD